MFGRFGIQFGVCRKQNWIRCVPNVDVGMFISILGGFAMGVPKSPNISPRNDVLFHMFDTVIEEVVYFPSIFCLYWTTHLLINRSGLPWREIPKGIEHIRRRVVIFWCTYSN